jgi:hypothetical protein
MTNEVTQVIQNHYWGTGSEWLWAFGQLLVVAFTLRFIAKQVWLQTKQTEIQTEQTKIQALSHVVQSVCTIQERWHSEAMQRVRFEVCNQWKNDKREFDGACEHIASFFEDLGALVKIKAIPKETIWDVQSWNIEYFWTMFEKGIVKIRQDYEEDVYCEFEKLFQEMRKISVKKGLPCVDAKSLDKFVKNEIRATKAGLELRKPGGYYGS